MDIAVLSLLFFNFCCSAIKIHKICIFQRLHQYECLVEGCEVKLKSYKSRQQHLIDKHKFPTSFEFLRKAKPSKHQRQKLQLKHLNNHHGWESKKESSMDIDIQTSKEVSCRVKEPKETRMEVEEMLMFLHLRSQS